MDKVEAGDEMARWVHVRMLFKDIIIPSALNITP